MSCKYSSISKSLYNINWNKKLNETILQTKALPAWWCFKELVCKGYIHHNRACTSNKTLSTLKELDCCKTPNPNCWELKYHSFYSFSAVIHNNIKYVHVKHWLIHDNRDPILRNHWTQITGWEIQNTRGW